MVNKEPISTKGYSAKPSPYSLLWGGGESRVRDDGQASSKFQYRPSSNLLPKGEGFKGKKNPGFAEGNR